VSLLPFVQPDRVQFTLENHQLALSNSLKKCRTRTAAETTNNSSSLWFALPQELQLDLLRRAGKSTSGKVALTCYNFGSEFISNLAPKLWKEKARVRLAEMDLLDLCRHLDSDDGEKGNNIRRIWHKGNLYDGYRLQNRVANKYLTWDLGMKDQFLVRVVLDSQLVLF